MKLKYFGTAAAEGFPGIFCDCEPCRKALKAGGKNIRTRSQALIDDKLLIDFPPDTYLHVLNYGLDLRNITSCIITHAHTDHFYATDLEMRREGFAYANDLSKRPPLDFYLSEKSAKPLESELHKSLIENGTISANIVKAFTPFEAEGYTITPLKASHDPKVEPFIYIIAKDKTMLYGNDTGYFCDETWAYIKESKVYFDLVSLDCTGIILKDYKHNHMSLESNMEIRDRLLEIGAADEKTIFISHHFSHNGGLVHDEFVPIAAKEGFLVSYDGMEVEF